MTRNAARLRTTHLDAAWVAALLRLRELAREHAAKMADKHESQELKEG